VRARSVMMPISEALPLLRSVGAAKLRVALDETLARLVEIAADTDQPIVVTDGAGRDVGIVTRELLLSRMAGRPSPAPSGWRRLAGGPPRAVAG